jgi:hypothetical protein
MAKRYSILDEGLVSEFSGRPDGIGQFSHSLGPSEEKMEAAIGFKPMHRGFADLPRPAPDPKKPRNSEANVPSMQSPNTEFSEPFSQSSRMVSPVSNKAYFDGHS